MRRLLITGKDSYIGTSVENWLNNSADKYLIQSLDMRSDDWQKHSFSDYDTVFHVAGIAHVSNDPDMEELYYRVNRDLAIQTAQKAKAEGVKQFIFMSSIIVYTGCVGKDGVITKETIPDPQGFYGKSKKQAEEGIIPLCSDTFKVVIVRPPMIYGKGSKGNYPRLAKAALKLPVFPDYPNQRSMLHIDNLCEFIKVMIDNDENGTFYPQNKEYVQTSRMVELIAQAHGKKVRTTRMLNPFVKLTYKAGLVRKVFGNLIYEQAMSQYVGADYQVRDLKTSIELTESGE